MTTLHERILERFENSPVGQQLRREGEVEHLARRQFLVQELSRLCQSRVAVEAELSDHVRIAQARVVDAERALVEATAAAAAARAAKLHASVTADLQEGRLRNELFDGADPEIQRFLDLVPRLQEQARRRAEAVREVVNRGPISEPRRSWKSLQRPADAREFRSEIAAIVDAARAAETLRLEALEPAQVAARLATIRASVPALER
jgi:hypothetical protein